jgi:CDP-paratose 2-epimerase
MSKRILVTGSAGLIGGEMVSYFSEQGYLVHGIDNNQRKIFFGEQADTKWNRDRLIKKYPQYEHYSIDIRNRQAVLEIVSKIRPFAIIHTAAQPSHDKAASIPFDDFETNATGTLNLLEAARLFAPEAPFVFLSTNKVYGDSPNYIPLKELDTRWDFDDQRFVKGISESFNIDQSKHSLFGASKLAADILVQEYGRYFNMPTVCLRGGCLTGPGHSGVELHGFLSYLVKCNVTETRYTIYGYKGKQVRDNIHSYDVSKFADLFINNPKAGVVYNIGGGKQNSCSILEAFEIVKSFTGKNQLYNYTDKPREGDHICYYSDLTKIKRDYPEWDISVTLEDTLKQIVQSWEDRLSF